MNERIRVITIGSDSSVKGGITSVINQIRSYQWKNNNIEMDFIPTYIEASSISKCLFFMKSYKIIEKYIKLNKPEVAHIHMSHGGSFIRKYYIHKLCKKYGLKDIIHLHSSSFVDFYKSTSYRNKKKIKELLEECDKVIVLGEEWERRIKSITPNAKTQILKNSVRIPDNVINQESNLISILYLGVLIKRKGVDDLLNAFIKLKDDGIFEKYNVLLRIGGRGDREEELRRIVLQNKLEKNVEFLGWVSGEEKEKYLLESQMLVLPSYNEGLPIAILEAISYGMPVLATNVGSVSEAVHNTENGYLVEPGDINALTKVLRLLIEDKELRISMSVSSRKLAEKVFNDKNYYKKLEDIYRTLSDKCKSV